jgi:hypothetical protein
VGRSWIFGIVLGWATDAYAQTATLVADTHSDAGAATANFGARQSILVSGTQRGFVQFAMPAAPERGQLARAVLRLYGSWVTTPGSVEAGVISARGCGYGKRQRAVRGN